MNWEIRFDRNTLTRVKQMASEEEPAGQHRELSLVL